MNNMTPEQFVYWLQGFMEVANPTTLDETQTQQIKDHLNLVFDKQTPDRSPGLFPGWNPQNPPSPMTGAQMFPDPTTIIPPMPYKSDPDWTYRPNITYDEDIANKKICSSTTPTHSVVKSAEKLVEGTVKLPKKFRGGVKC